MKPGTLTFEVEVEDAEGNKVVHELLAPTPEAAAYLAERTPGTGVSRGTAEEVVLRLKRLGKCRRCGTVVLGQTDNHRDTPRTYCGSC